MYAISLNGDNDHVFCFVFTTRCRTNPTTTTTATKSAHRLILLRLAKCNVRFITFYFY